MQFIILKYFFTAGIVVLVSEVVKNLDKAGALIAALPTVTLLTLFWLYFEGHSAEKITNHAWYAFWYVIPTLPMFAAFPVLVQRFGFWGGIAFSILITVLFFNAFALILRRFTIDLMRAYSSDRFGYCASALVVVCRQFANIR
jgi:hypothetical protein